MATLKEHYDQEIVPKLTEQFGYTSRMQVPNVIKITVNMGLGEGATDKKVIDVASTELARIGGQKPIVTKARKSVASFKIRDGFPIGLKLTLRRERMYEFMERLIQVALPRVRDFRGISPKSFDGKGNYNLGIQEQIIFPEIGFDEVDAVRGMDIALTTSAHSDEEGYALLAAYGMPFRSR